VTSKSRSVLNIAMSGLKVDIMRYLVVEKGVPVYETKDLQLSLRALEAVLLAFPAKHDEAEFQSHDIVVPRWDETNYSDDGQGSYDCSSLGEDHSANIADLSSFHENQPIETVDLVSYALFIQHCVVVVMCLFFSDLLFPFLFSLVYPLLRQRH